MRSYTTTNFYGARLPHWEVDRGVYFVTMHVKGSLPRPVLQELEQLAREARTLERDAQLQRYRRMFAAMEGVLHADRSIDYLVRPEIAAICREAIVSRHRRDVWDMIEYVLMPNHIHLFFELRSGDVKSTLESFKRWTSKEASKILDLSRSLWQQDWFDRWSRSEGQDQDIAHYIRMNPVKAGLVDTFDTWPWGSWNDPQLKAAKHEQQSNAQP